MIAVTGPSIALTTVSALPLPLSSFGGPLLLSSVRLNVGEDPKILELLRNTEDSVQRAKGITKQLQTFTRQSKLEKSNRYLTPLLKEGLKFALRGSAVQPKFELQDDLWPVDIDAGQISQVIYNLAINSVHAMPEGGNLLVTTANITVDDGKPIGPFTRGQYVVVSVRDEGKGIPPGIQKQIFDPYFTTKETGTGLGLFSVYNIIDKHDGWITVKSKVNKGTTFTFYLPAAVGAVIQPYLRDLQLILGEGRILVIQDDELNRNALRQLLEDLGFEVSSATDGTEALELLKEAQSVGKQFRAAVIDFIISGEMSGADSLQHIRQIDPKIKAIIMSGHTNMPVMTNYRDYGFQGRLVKPFAASELSAALNNIFAEE